MTSFFERYEKHLLAFLIISTVFLRFWNLDYSEYLLDEPGTFLFRGASAGGKFGSSVTEFILTQKKGPMQILIGLISYTVVGDYRNELAQRIPFALFNSASVIVFYFFIKRITKSKSTAFFASFLFSVSGFITAFGRVAQYQSLNLFFSFAALYFYASLLESYPESVEGVKNTLLGTLMYSFSILSHWDALYVFPVIAFIFVKFLLNSDFSHTLKIKLILSNIVLGCLILLPFLIPYINRYLVDNANQLYFASRVGLRETFDNSGDIFRFRLYHPFLAFEFLVIFALLGIIFDAVSFFRREKNAGIFTVWFVFCFIVFKFFIHHSGTHIYNLVIPVLVLCAVSLNRVALKLPNRIRVLSTTIIVLFFAFFYYQTYLLFVDHSVEYPWSREKILVFETRKYTHEDNTRHLIGFPIRRNWKEINIFVNEQNVLNDENFGYYTNEDKDLSNFYMDVEHRNHGGVYAVGIKKPLSFVNDYKFPAMKNKRTVKKIEVNGENKVRIYRVEVE